MYRLLLLLALVLIAAFPVRAQLGSFGDVPIDINAEESRFEGGLAVAEHNVLIQYGDVTIYSDYAQYNPDTRDVLVLGNVRIYRQGKLFTGERAVYNLETKQLTAADFRGEVFPFLFSAETLNSLGPNAYQARNAVLTTSDSSKPDYTMRAKSVRIYPNDRVVLRDVFLYIGQTPVLWLPYIYQSLNKEQGLLLAPGYTSTLGYYLFSRYTYPFGENGSITLRLDVMSDRGVAIGLESKWEGKDKKDDFGRFKAYYLYDSAPTVNKTNTNRGAVDPNRYRVSLQDRTYQTEDIYSTIDINKLSDARFLADFEAGEFKRDPNPDNVIALTKWDENYTATLTARKSLNDFLDFTERLPELALDFKKQPIFGKSGLYYTGETSGAWLRRTFGADSIFSEYESARVDTYHQLLFPQTIHNWLSIVPRAGVRFTFYSNSGSFNDKLTTQHILDSNGLDTGDTQITVTPQLNPSGAVYRVAADAGLEMSFKLSRAYEEVQSRPWGLDGLRHVVQPYLDFSYVYTTVDPTRILQFDRINPSTRLPPVDFPDFNAIDSIQNQAIVQLGTHNRFETRRDNTTFLWLEWNSFINLNIKRPEFEQSFLARSEQPAKNQPFDKNASLRGRVADPGTFSNLYNTFKWAPVPWAALSLDSQAPILDQGFWEVNTSANFQTSENLQLLVSHRYLSGNAYFDNSNQLTVGAYYRISDNWGATVRETYEFNAGLLQQQRYELHRDLSSWVATFGVVLGDNGGGKEDYGVQFAITLKELPQARIMRNLDPADLTGTGKNQ